MKITNAFFNGRQTRQHIEQVTEKKLLPFLESAENLLNQFGNRFKLGMSISGITIRLLEQYAPQGIEKIKHLANKEVVEFTAEPWSNSILPWFIQNELTTQTNLHRRTIEAAFGQLPAVFMADLPLNAENFSSFKPFDECRTTFTCSNHLNESHSNEKNRIKKKVQFLINQALSHKFQLLSSDKSQTVESHQIAPFIRYLRKHASLVRPLVLVFDPLADNISKFSKWEKIVSLLLEKTKSSLYSISDLEEIANYFSIDSHYSEHLRKHFEMPDYWLKNNMQKEAFKQFKNVYKIIHTSGYSYIPEAWEYLQDLNNFLYMSDAFFKEEFASRHYSPYQSPHEAFTSYMNAISNFFTESTRNQKPVIKTNFLFSPASN